MSTPNTRLATFLEQCRNQIDAELERQLCASGQGSERLQQAMRYSVLGGGKRIRPALCLAAATALGQPRESAIVPACSLELINAYWLAEAPGLDDQVRLAMIRELATASGHQGMAGGQAIDLESVGKRLTVEQLEKMHRHKTGALIAASVRMGALTATDVGEDQLAALTVYSQTLGLAFQVQDDLLDIEGDTTVIGKPQGSDLARSKPTYPSLLGADGARNYLSQLLESALASIEMFGEEGDLLRDMAGYVVARTH